MTTFEETMTTVSRPTEDALIGIERALSNFERCLEEANEKCRSVGLEPDPKSQADFRRYQEAARRWIMQVQHEIHADDVANDR